VIGRDGEIRTRDPLHPMRLQASFAPAEFITLPKQENTGKTSLSAACIVLFRTVLRKCLETNKL
jgi:hypothetical protein